LKRFCRSLMQTELAGVLLVIPIYLAILLLLKAMKSLGALILPVARLLPLSLPRGKIASGRPGGFATAWHPSGDCNSPK